MSNLRKPLVYFALLWAVYIGSYIVLSLAGRYEDNFGALAKISPACLCISDVDEWQPAFLTVASFSDAGMKEREIKANLGGYFYLPLVIADQHYWHVTRRLS